MRSRALLIVADTGQAVLAPVVGARPRLVVAEICPGVAVLAVILANRAPLALAQIGPPLAPRNTGFACFPESGGLQDPLPRRSG